MSTTKGKVAIIGSGLIGRCWAVVFSRGGFSVTLYDTEKTQLEAVMPDVKTKLAAMSKSNALQGQNPDDVASRVSTSTDLKETLKDAIYVQECTPENLDIKIKVFTELDTLASPDTILASSTSAIVASKFTENLKGRHRCLVAHPINPPHLIPLVEIVPAPWTSPEVVAKVRTLMDSIGNKPVVLNKEVRGFAQNRLQYALLAEAFRLVEDGVLSPADVDTTVIYGLAMRYSFMGPFQTIDLNAPQGVSDYCNRYLDGISRTLETQDNNRKVSAETVATINAHQRSLFPVEQLGQVSEWRNQRLLALTSHYQDCKDLDKALLPQPHQ